MKHRSDLNCCANKENNQITFAKLLNIPMKSLDNELSMLLIVFFKVLNLKSNFTLIYFFLRFECFVKCSCILPFLDV